MQIRAIYSKVNIGEYMVDGEDRTGIALYWGLCDGMQSCMDDGYANFGLMSGDMNLTRDL